MLVVCFLLLRSTMGSFIINVDRLSMVWGEVQVCSCFLWNMNSVLYLNLFQKGRGWGENDDMLSTCVVDENELCHSLYCFKPRSNMWASQYDKTRFRNKVLLISFFLFFHFDDDCFLRVYTRKKNLFPLLSWIRVKLKQNSTQTVLQLFSLKQLLCSFFTDIFFCFEGKSFHVFTDIFICDPFQK